MSVRHRIGILALLSWYLMVPPSIGSDQIDVNAPLSHWKIQATFDTVARCKDQIQQQLDSLNDKSRAASQLDRSRYLNAHCVADDDLRLKAK
ncbi:MAG TPA: hypothetical protein VEJ86_03720 [Candidatus Binataceae bacterium]|nr:hypothetical protein [Candidatus Binataceae bacterium]